jgi:uncharacterized lipoprotein
MSRYLVLVGVSVALFFTSGCALTTDVIHVRYVSASKAVKLPGAENVTVKVNVVDGRQDRTRVSVKKNGYGMEMAPIEDPDIVKTVNQAVVYELAKRGFAVGEGNVLVSVGLNKFFNDFKMGVFAGDAKAELMMDVQVKGADGSIRFAQTIISEGVNPDIMLAGGDEAKIALEAALNLGMRKLFSNEEFINAVNRQAAPQATVSPGV